MLTPYSDEKFVSDAYARELTGARRRRVEVEGVSDDPPERVAAWLGTWRRRALRALDLTLLLDLLRIEEDGDRWRELMTPLVGTARRSGPRRRYRRRRVQLIACWSASRGGDGIEARGRTR